MTLVVSAAVIRKPEGYWLVRRGPGLRDPGMWEFPGGKLEPGETGPQALEREMLEELGIGVDVGACLAVAEHAGIQLQAYAVEIRQGQPQLREHDDQAVIPLEAMDQYPMTHLERLIIEQLP